MKVDAPKRTAVKWTTLIDEYLRELNRDEYNPHTYLPLEWQEHGAGIILKSLVIDGETHLSRVETLFINWYNVTRLVFNIQMRV